MKPMLHTRWLAMDLIVSRDGQEIDRVCASDIERVIVVYGDRGVHLDLRGHQPGVRVCADRARWNIRSAVARPA